MKTKIEWCDYTMIELFGDWVNSKWMGYIVEDVRSNPQHTFIFLTKQPQNLIKWSPFPDNCWVGVSVTSAKDAIIRIPKLKDITAPVKFISFEPLLKPIASPNQLYIMLKLSGINWVIIGQQTPVNKATMLKVGWIQEIVRACDWASIPVFLKDNLISCVDQYLFAFSGKFPDIKLRQEFPKGIK